MLLSRSIIVCVCLLSSALLANASQANLIHFSWTDDMGQVGEFDLDTSMGYTPAAILDFSYILGDGSQTPPAFQVNSFTAFNNDTVWDINIGAEGVTFIFDTSISLPFSNNPLD